MYNIDCTLAGKYCGAHVLKKWVRVCHAFFGPSLKYPN